ncbi:hypothetical protein ACE7GA_21375 [Roseomonas sp. CCTCC AB2023176]|uniref:hypothetical protein n=1 Tax=Roseomonas sp. CCTCC AB2023176 TaxID=3342640 RepID=UPI0035E23467
MTAPTRRGALATLSALLALAAPAEAFVWPAPLPPPPPPGAHPDAELIRLCAAYVEAVDAYNRDGGHLECEDDPLWHAVAAVEEPLGELEPRTLAGLAAMARVAHFLAQQPCGENFSDSFTGDWPERVVRGVLTLAAVADGAASG